VPRNGCALTAFGSPEWRGRQFDYGSIGDTLPPIGQSCSIDFAKPNIGPPKTLHFMRIEQDVCQGLIFQRLRGMGNPRSGGTFATDCAICSWIACAAPVT
jgi:hypothetical protein